MAIKAIVVPTSNELSIGAGAADIYVSFIDTSTNQVVYNLQDYIDFGINLVSYTPNEFITAITTKVLSTASSQGYSMTSSDILWEIPTGLTVSEINQIKLATQPRSFTNNPSRTIQTVAAAANGFQLSATRDASVNYSATIVTAATLAAGAVGSVVLEVASTNSSSAGAWQEIGRITNGQVFSLAVAIGCTQTISGQLGGIVPAGYYARLRSINTTGTPTYTYNSGQEVLL